MKRNTRAKCRLPGLVDPKPQFELILLQLVNFTVSSSLNVTKSFLSSARMASNQRTSTFNTRSTGSRSVGLRKNSLQCHSEDSML